MDIGRVGYRCGENNGVCPDGYPWTRADTGFRSCSARYSVIDLLVVHDFV